jgi:adenosine kinase
MDILITGSVAFDYLMTFPGLFKEQILPERLEKISLSFLVDSMSRQRGGIAPNIAYTMALLGGKPRILATVGEDFADYRSWLEGQGIDTRLMQVVKGVYTASFFATTDRTNAQIASFYPGAMAYATRQSLRDVQPRPDLVVVSPNDPVAMKNFAAECRQMDIPFLYDPSQQVPRLEGDELAQEMQGAFFLFVNDYEFDLICKKTGLGLAELQDRIRVLVITRGADGSSIYTEGREYTIPVVTPEHILDPTGVGDAFRGGFLTGFGRGWGWELCGQIGALAATYCLEEQGPQSQHYTRSEFVQRFRGYFDDRGVLDALLSKS